MKNLLLLIPLLITSCASVQPGNVPIDQDGPVYRTIERVLERTEGYMAQPPGGMEIDPVSVEQVEAAIVVARTMLNQPEASGAMLMVTMEGIMGLHDVLVMQALLAGELEDGQLEADILLEDTARLRSLFASVNIHASLVGPGEPNPDFLAEPLPDALPVN
jgi:hypothetical protein